MAKKKVVVKETITEEQEELSKETFYCVKVKLFENGFLKKMKTRLFFKSRKEAEAVYNATMERGHRVELSVFHSGNEKIILFKDCK